MLPPVLRIGHSALHREHAVPKWPKVLWQYIFDTGTAVSGGQLDLFRSLVLQF